MTLPSGIPVDELDPGIRPQDDLFRHANGRWLARTEISADRARESTFRILADEAETAVREIAEEAASAPEGSEERKFGDVYASFMDANRAERLGSHPIGPALAAARAVSSIPELLETLGRLQPLGIGGGQRFFVSWARVWKTKVRDTEAIRLLAIDPHSPGEFRCNQIVRNLDEFYDAFDVGTTDGLWLEPATRVRIW